MTPQGFAQSVQNFIINFPEEIEKVEGGALFTLLGSMQRRIHNSGKDSEGNSLGGYTDAWAKKRQSKKPGKRQIRYKDLVFNGDLQKRVVVGTYDEKKVIGYLVDIDRIKVEGNEENLGVNIYSARTKSEQDEFDLNISEGVAGILEKYMK